jgi:nitroreductase
MNAKFPDDKTIREVLTLAARAPSVHNSQPWRWHVGERSLDLRCVPALHLRATDPDGRDLMLSCGAALHHGVVALAALGWHAEVHRFPNPVDANHVATIEVQRQGCGELDVKLAAAIPRRRTDRRLYSPWPVPPGDLALLETRAAAAGVMVRRVDALARLRAIVVKAVRQHSTDRDYLTELTTWSGRHDSVAGVPARSTPSPDPTAMIPGRLFAGAELEQPPGATAAEDNAVVLALGTADDDPLQRLRAGEASSLVLLTATALGLSSCPVTEPLQISETRAEVRATVFGDTGFPQMLLRVGWAPINADPLPSTPRRPLAEIVTWTSGSPTD